MSSYNVLIIDDDDAIRDALGSFVEIAGFSVKTTGSATDAYELFKNGDIPPLVICDISMPGMSGLTFLEKIREKNWSCAVVMMTAHVEKEKIIDALRLGAIDYVCKPFEPEQFMQNLPNWFKMGMRLQALHAPETENSESVAKQLRLIELYRLKIKGASVA